jgi:hypothetical protein
VSNRQLTNNTQIPLALAVWLATDEYNYVSDPKQISVTSLLKPIKSIVLSMQEGVSKSTDIADLVASKLGTAIHSSVEYAWLNPKLPEVLKSLGYPDKLVNSIRINPTSQELVDGIVPVYLEQRVNKEIEGFTVSGQFDMVIDGSLFDIKSTGTFNYINQSNSQKYIQQASIYRWLNPTIVTNDTFSILYCFTDWSSVKAKQETDYPKSRLLQQKFQLMSIQETEQFIKDKVRQINKYVAAPHELPDCTPEELWMKPSVFKYYKNPDKMDRSTKNFDTYWEANQRMTEDGSVGKVVEVKGEAVFCKYCAACGSCSQAAKLIQEGRLIV